MIGSGLCDNDDIDDKQRDPLIDMPALETFRYI